MIEKKEEKIEEKKVEKKDEKKENKISFKFGYRDFDLTPISDFDFVHYKGNWCRYCGSRFTKMFRKGPWGKMKLCYHHFLSWKTNRLDLQKFKKEPREPIDKGRDTEIKYLNLMQDKLQLKPVQTILRLKEMMLEEQQNEHEK